MQRHKPLVNELLPRAPLLCFWARGRRPTAIMEEQLAELKRREAACAANRDYIAVLPRLRASAASQGEGG